MGAWTLVFVLTKLNVSITENDIMLTHATVAGSTAPPKSSLHVRRSQHPSPTVVSESDPQQMAVGTDGTSREFWNTWNATNREGAQGAVSHRQAEVVRGWLVGRSELSILDAGCGSGWLCEQITSFGAVVGTDLADEVIARAQERVPTARFVRGDIMSVDVGHDFDVVVSLEVLSHVADQVAFLRRLHDWLRPGGQLMLATQNKPVLARFNRIPPSVIRTASAVGRSTRTQAACDRSRI